MGPVGVEGFVRVAILRRFSMPEKSNLYDTTCEIDPMKVVSSIGALKYRHPDCQVVKRRGRIYVICKSNPRFKVRQGGAKVKKTRR